MQLVIHNLREKQISTSRGPSTVVSFKSGDIWYSAFKGSWNADWADGLELEIPDDRIKVTTKGEYTNHNIQAPPKAEQDLKKKQEMDLILKGIAEIWKDVQLIKQKLGIPLVTK